MVVLGMLDRPTYLYAEVDRLIGLPGGTSRRWINGYRRGGKFYAPILRKEPSESEWATWGEFVETRILAEFRSERVPTARLRAAVEKLRQDYGEYPLAHLRPYLDADARRLMIADGDGDDRDWRDLVTGQRILGAGAELMREHARLEVDPTGQEFASELQLDPNFPQIWTHPDRMSGQPTIGQRRIAAATVAGMVEAGEPEESIAELYEISIDSVREAVGYAHKYRLAA